MPQIRRKSKVAQPKDWTSFHLSKVVHMTYTLVEICQKYLFWFFILPLLSSEICISCIIINKNRVYWFKWKSCYMHRPNHTHGQSGDLIILLISLKKGKCTNKQRKQQYTDRSLWNKPALWTLSLYWGSFVKMLEYLHKWWKCFGGHSLSYKA
jgi:hypothetical protein